MPEVIICPVRCYPCMGGDHHTPPTPHTWMAEDDAEHAGHPWPLPDDVAAANVCGCHCAHDPDGTAIWDDPRDVARAALRHLADRLDAKETR